jgi:hypothetical protein
MANLDKAVARLLEFRIWSERSVAQFHKYGCHQFAEEFRVACARTEKDFEDTVMIVAAAESAPPKDVGATDFSDNLN